LPQEISFQSSSTEFLSSGCQQLKAIVYSINTGVNLDYPFCRLKQLAKTRAFIALRKIPLFDSDMLSLSAHQILEREEGLVKIENRVAEFIK
jgi:hypothetical protein